MAELMVKQNYLLSYYTMVVVVCCCFLRMLLLSTTLRRELCSASPLATLGAFYSPMATAQDE